jgi:iron complex outermembrane receptor protein
MPRTLSKTQHLQLIVALAAFSAGSEGLTAAAELPLSDSTAPDTLAEVVVTGTRQGGFAAADSPAPIQVLSNEALQTVAASPDLSSALAQIVPSLTIGAFGADMANNTLQAKLRGLSPNDVLVLIDGKRRHTTANLAVDYGSAYQGGANVDLNFIPLDAIDHIEVLTDGAAAQYGTDAIAGVINIILKKSSSGGSLTATKGGYFDGGGDTGDVSGNIGLAPSDNAYLNVTGEVHNHGHSMRSGVDERVVNPANLATYPGSNMLLTDGYPYLNLIQGDAESHLKLLSLNSGLTLGEDTEIYLVGTYGSKTANSFENYRPPYISAYLDPASGETQYQYPFGFNPQEQIDETDYAVTAGAKGNLANWKWDLSNAWGSDAVRFHTLHSSNPLLYAATGSSPEDFYDGELLATQWTTSLDLNRDFAVGLANPLNVAFGGEVRRDTYETRAGSFASYTVAGAAAYPGFTPANAGQHARTNAAGYLDVAAQPVQGLRIDAAGRFEHYSDFGSSTVGKLTSRYDFTQEFAVRGTVSNGFRAPTLAEEYYSATDTGPINTVVQIPPNSSAARLLGLGSGLQPEKSINYSVGFVFRPLPTMNTTLDLYQISIKNRIVGSANLYGYVNSIPFSNAVNEAIAATGTFIAPGVQTTGINIFTNGINTRTRGADLVFDFPANYAFGSVDWSLGATYNDTAVTYVRPSPSVLVGQQLFDATAISDLTTAAPRFVVNMGALWKTGNLTVNLVEKIYGPSSEWENDDGDNTAGSLEYFRSTISMTPITNITVGYQITKHLKASLGATNLLNRYPNHLNSTLLSHYDNFAYGDNQGTINYPGFSPFGFDGGFYFAKATYSFGR